MALAGTAVVTASACREAPPAARTGPTDESTLFTNLVTHLKETGGGLSTLRASSVTFAPLMDRVTMEGPSLRTEVPSLWQLLSVPVETLPVPGRSLPRLSRAAAAALDPSTAPHDPAGGSREADEPNPAAPSGATGTKSHHAPPLLLEAPVSLDQPLNISADHFEADVTSRRGTFTGHVRLEWDRLVIRCDRLLVASVEASGARATTLLAEGDVQFAWPDYQGSAGKLVYDSVAHTLVLEHDPVLAGGGVTLTGPRVVVDLATGRIRCTHCRVEWTLEAKP